MLQTTIEIPSTKLLPYKESQSFFIMFSELFISYKDILFISYKVHSKCAFVGTLVLSYKLDIQSSDSFLIWALKWLPFGQFEESDRWRWKSQEVLYLFSWSQVDARDSVLRNLVISAKKLQMLCESLSWDQLNRIVIFWMTLKCLDFQAPLSSEGTISIEQIDCFEVLHFLYYYSEGTQEECPFLPRLRDYCGS